MWGCEPLDTPAHTDSEGLYRDHDGGREIKRSMGREGVTTDHCPVLPPPPGPHKHCPLGTTVDKQEVRTSASFAFAVLI
ncbi:hypothetical protein J6590_036802 [Homalodisca vitripennis]|nr:hypothetical protein J6590_036802 [Homalodisca vitripennis]